MICNECSNCGLCPGNRIYSTDLNVQLKKQVFGKFNCNSSLSSNDVGIAFDLGTTTIACSLLSLSTGEELLSFGEVNKQIEFGIDVVSRISYAISNKEFEQLHLIILKQLEQMINRAMQLCQVKFTFLRKGRAKLCEISVAGNTTMQSFLAGVSVENLACYPFNLESSFGFEISSLEVFGTDFPFECSIYFAPVISAFIGGDIVCAMIASGFLCEDKKTKFLVDVGTNCEMCVKDVGSNKIICTSTSAGPAFEGFGIECGDTAGKGSVVKIQIKNNEILCKVLGGGLAKKISGTGILSIISEFLKNDFIEKDGKFKNNEDKIYLNKELYISQKDIRQFQLAKGSVFCGLKILSKEIKKNKEVQLFLAGGFGTSLDINDAVNVKMIPKELSFNVYGIGNASLAGASMLLVDKNLRTPAENLAKKSILIDLSQEKNFQNEFIQSLDF